ncbi:MAG: hypothetical protein C0402_09400 [Thermodesulfovibrio sp.]|nr:hypothetical protein [Thermodesulfovibrio sp.]
MDSELQTLMDLATRRGNKYLKGNSGLADISTKMAELGVMLLEVARRFPDLAEQRSKEELIEVQQKLDDLRKSIFTSKIKSP